MTRWCIEANTHIYKTKMIKTIILTPLDGTVLHFVRLFLFSHILGHFTGNADLKNIFVPVHFKRTNVPHIFFKSVFLSYKRTHIRQQLNITEITMYHTGQVSISTVLM